MSASDATDKLADNQLTENERIVSDFRSPTAITYVPENHSSRTQKNEKIVAGFFICLLLALSALCAGLPSTAPYASQDDVGYEYDRGDTAWVIVASALGNLFFIE